MGYEERKKDEGKRKAFDDNPDDFIFKGDLIMAARRTEKGVEVFFGQSRREEMMQGYAELSYRYLQMLDRLEAIRAANEAANKRIIAPGR